MSEIQLSEVSNLITISKEQLDKINKRLPEYHRASLIIGHSTSQTSYSLQTMQMMSDSPLSRMKQCLSQINRKYQALQEAYYKIENKKLEIEELGKLTDKQSKLTIREHESTINTISTSMENALRQIGMFQDMYDNIRKNNDIPENWSEKDYEKQEISHMIKSSFRLGIQDIMATGRPSMAVVEYWEQLGINPQVGFALTEKYLFETRELIKNDKEVTITNMHMFLDKMYEKFKDSYKLALKRIGLDSIGSESYMADGVTKPQ